MAVQFKKAQKSTNDRDRRIGSLIRYRRIELGMSQEKLGDAINLTFQQIQKYEKGTNRVAVSRLFEISAALKVPVSYFLDLRNQSSVNPPDVDLHLAMRIAKLEPLQQEQLRKIIDVFATTARPGARVPVPVKAMG